MIQDEWRFMHDDEPTGKDLEDTETEFRRWIRENVNHPSIVAWDQENRRQRASRSAESRTAPL